MECLETSTGLDALREANRSLRSFLARVPVRVMEHGRHAVLGAANWYLRRAGVIEPPASNGGFA